VQTIWAACFVLGYFCKFKRFPFALTLNYCLRGYTSDAHIPITCPHSGSYTVGTRWVLWSGGFFGVLWRSWESVSLEGLRKSRLSISWLFIECQRKTYVFFAMSSSSSFMEKPSKWDPRDLIKVNEHVLCRLTLPGSCCQMRGMDEQVELLS
jgi:hypothetical protein